MRLASLVLALVLVLGPLSRAVAQVPTHPLDDLSSAEYWALYETLRADSRVSEDAEFLYAGLQEPSKAAVLAWSPGSTFQRHARVHFVQDYPAMNCPRCM